MKEATGELNMTVITVVAIAAIAGIFYAWVWPAIQKSIAKNTCKAECGENADVCNSLKESDKSYSWSCTGTTQTGE